MIYLLYVIFKVPNLSKDEDTHLNESILLLWIIDRKLTVVIHSKISRKLSVLLISPGNRYV